MLRFELNQSGPVELLRHLERCSGQFSPPLAERVELAGYAQKLVDRAVRFEAWDGAELVGCVAAYLNASTGECFISNVSVVPTHLRRGVAQRLLERCLELARERSLKKAVLEVSETSDAALGLYERLGFSVIERRAAVVVMARDLDPA